MRRLSLGAFFLLLAPELRAIPNSFFGNGNVLPTISAFPCFNADLTEEFLSEESRQEQSFSGPRLYEPGILDLHRTVADEFGRRVGIKPSFDVKWVARSIEEGLPVIVKSARFSVSNSDPAG